MKVGLKAKGFQQVMAQLNHAADRVHENGRKTMHRGADKIVKEAKLNAPVDEHNLEESIKKVVSKGVRNRLKINIVAGGMVNGVNVTKYAVAVHENYSSKKPGSGTIQKRAANPGRYIGEKFIDRAVDNQEDKLMKALVEATKRSWQL